MARFFKFLIAFLLLPTLVWAVAEGVQIFMPVLGHFRRAWPFFAGVLLYPILHYMTKKSKKYDLTMVYFAYIMFIYCVMLKEGILIIR